MVLNGLMRLSDFHDYPRTSGADILFAGGRVSTHRSGLLMWIIDALSYILCTFD